MEQLLIVSGETTWREESLSVLAGCYVVHTVSDAREATAFLMRHNADVVLVDLELGDWGSFTVLSVAVALDPKPVVIMVGGANDIRKAVKAMRLGANDYLPHPVDAAAIACAIQRCSPARSMQCA